MAEVTIASVILRLIFWAAVVAVLAAMVITDVRERRIPNKLVAALGVLWVLMQAQAMVFGAIAGCSLTEAAQAGGIPQPLLHLFALPHPAIGVLTAAAAVAFLAAMGALYERFADKQAMGAGDMKLIGAFALFLGPVPTVACVVLACAFALAAAVPLRQRAFPFAPALTLAFICVIFVEL